jgi:hypothetical protein
MVAINKLRAVLPPFKNETTVIVDKQSTNDIINGVLEKHRQYETDYDNIYRFFYTGDIYTTCKQIWEFCKYNLQYVVESENLQSVKSPAAILQPGGTVDCKHYSLFIAGILDAIQANQNESWVWCYRFASYDNNRSPEHVFVVVKDNGSEIWIDPVLGSFDERLKPTYFKDKNTMSLVSISGIGTVNNQSTTITVDKDEAENSFLAMVNANVFGIKTLLKRNSDITNGTVKDWYVRNGYDFGRLQNMLKY